MFVCNRIVIFLCATITCSTTANAFFLSWGASDSSTIQQGPIEPYPVTTYYHHRLLQPPPPPSGDGQTQPLQIPAIPIQVPLQAQFSPASNAHNVQLVPCLCPVSSDFEYERASEASSNVYVNQMKNPSQNN